MHKVQRPSERASAGRPGLADLSDELLAMIVNNIESTLQKLEFSQTCRRFHGILFHPKALGSVTLSIDRLGKKDKDASMDAVRFLLRRITAVSSIHVTSWAVLEGVRKNSVSNFACFCLPLLLQPMAAEGVQLSLDLHQYFETGDLFFGAGHLFNPEDWDRFAPSLTFLRLAGLASPITAAHMRALCALPNLETLSLSRRARDSRDSQTAQISDLSSLKSISMPKLRSLKLECARLSSLCFTCSALSTLTLRSCTYLAGSSFAGCTQLQCLALQNMELDGGNEGAWLAKELHGLEALQQLKINFCNLRTVPHSLSSLESLQMLDLRGNNLNELPHDLPRNLRDLDVDRNIFECIPSELCTLSCLETLCVSDQREVNFQLDSSLLPLISLPKLQCIWLDRGQDFPCWNIDSYWHIGEALRAIESSGKKMKLYCEHAEAEDEESDASESD